MGKSLHLPRCQMMGLLMARLLTKDISAIYYLDPDTHVQDPTYGGLTKLTPEELLGAMVTCSEKNYAW